MFKKCFLTLPKKTRINIWKKGRQKSQAKKLTEAAYLGDINHDYAVQECQRLRCKLMIHGHTHQPVIDHLGLKKQVQRLTLPSWEDRAGYATINQNSLELRYLDASLKSHDIK